MKTPLLLPTLLVGAVAAALVSTPDKGFTVHEWGTFTCVQGADGVQMVWNPLVAPELPAFVHNDQAFPGAGFKIAMATRQRMETPVMYFYSDRERTADVAVRFPQGRVTEWFPDQAVAKSRQWPQLDGKDVPVLHWKELRIQSGSGDTASLPVDKSSSRYYAARETDASLLRTATNQTTETEKFLFYRGVADFTAPLTVKLKHSDSRQVSLSNSGPEELKNLYLYEVRADGGLSWMSLDKLAAGATQSLDLAGARGVGADSLAAALRNALVREGLYEKEAAAMVKTWESAWFGEHGMRVLYTFPRAWIDRTLPLAITPAPKAIERVMVGRAEIITPQMEQALLTEVNRYVAATPLERPKIVAETRALGMGRFTEVAMQRLRAGGKRSDEFYKLSWELAQAATAGPPVALKLDRVSLTAPAAGSDIGSLPK